MSLQTSEGIVLHTLKYGERDQILTVFTRQEGLIKLFYKGAFSGKKCGAALLTRAEFVYFPKQNSLMTCREMTLVHSYLKLRKSLACLEGAFTIAKSLLSSQCEQKYAPQLYELLICYLERLPEVSQPQMLAASFLLKILRHDGLFGLTPHCKKCLQELSTHYIVQGESYCFNDKPLEAIVLSSSEADTLFMLAFSRSFALLECLEVSPSLYTHIETLFHSLVS